MNIIPTKEDSSWTNFFMQPSKIVYSISVHVWLNIHILVLELFVSCKVNDDLKV